MPELIHSPDARLLMLGAGIFFINEWDNAGAPTYFRHMGNIGSGELTQSTTEINIKESMTRARNTYLNLIKDQTFTLRLVLDEWSAKNMGLYLKGDVVSTAAQAATPVVGEPLATDAVLGATYFPAKYGPFTAATLKTGSTELDEGVDYIIDMETGAVTLLTTATNIMDGDPLSIDYTPTAYASGITRIRAGTRKTVRGAIRFYGDPQNGPRQIIQFHKATIRPDANAALISPPDATTTTPLTLVATLEADLINHPESPLFDDDLLKAG